MTLPGFIARLFSYTPAVTEDDLAPEMARPGPQAIDLVVATVA